MTRVALISDFLEDRWYSMDLVAEMLHSHLSEGCADTCNATLIRPPMKFRFGALPVLGRGGIARKADQVWNRFLEYPRLLRTERKQFDVFHIVDHSYAQLVHDLPPERTLLTCHDLDAFRCITEPRAEPRSGLFRAMSRRILTGFQRAAKVVCDSAAIRDEILRFGLLPPERLAVLPLAVAPGFSAKADPVADSEVDRLLGPAHAGAIDILHVGSTVPRKRIDIVLRVFSKVKEQIPHARLIRSGGQFTSEQRAMMDDLQLWDSTIVLPFLSRESLSSVYRRASVALQPSSREGFGLPVIEAMACGAPVIASDIPVLRETGGSAASYCALEDIEAWRDCVLKTVSRGLDHPERAAARAAGIAQAGKFTWLAYAEGSARLYQELLTK
jgi:glycosyltransferase involved in cell wall biosynthesis